MKWKGHYDRAVDVHWIDQLLWNVDEALSSQYSVVWLWTYRSQRNQKTPSDIAMMVCAVRLKDML